MLDWNKLISSERLGLNNHNLQKDARTEFERDIDRIIFSSAFRRLQNKTQVFPIPKSDFIHSRLTHSIEVASVGRSLGKLIGKFIIKKHGPITDANKQETISEDSFGDIVAAACLAHDIGNPPFGHSGEDAFRHYFEEAENNNARKLFASLSPAQKDDFLRFEGNAEGFRILTNDHPSGIAGGLKLTLTTLATFCKYTCEGGVIIPNNLSNKCQNRRSLKKLGVMQSEKEIYKSIAEKLGLLKLSDSQIYYTRHPLSFVMEAADNISYQIMDLEDGHKLGLVSTEEVISLLAPFVNSIEQDPCDIRSLDAITDKNEQVGAYRAKAINSLIYQVSMVFEDKYDEIMRGEFDSELTDLVKQKDDFKKIENIKAEKIFNYYKVVSIESAGRYAIKELLEIYLNAYNNLDKKYAKNIISMLPSYHQVKVSDSPYDVLLRLTTYLSRMTDNFAIDQYRSFTGQKFPEIN